MSSLIQPPQSAAEAAPPEFLPARMLNEFVYCPRLFYYEWVEGLFAHNRETMEGQLRHRRFDEQQDELPEAAAVEAGEAIHSRSVTLSSETHRLIARLDLLEGADGVVTPVDYKRGSPRARADGTLEAWDTDRVQLAAQALVLRDNGYRCEEGVIFYVATKQRVRVPIDENLVAQTLAALARAFETATSAQMPPPLVDSPKCPRCSLVGICLPDETHACLAQQVPVESSEAEPVSLRRLLPARDDLRPLYLNTQGLSVGKSGHVLQIREKGKLLEEVRMQDICQLNLFGNIQLTTQAIQTLCQNEIPVAYFSQGGWFYGMTHGLGLTNIFLRREQFRLADEPEFCLQLARSLVAAKIRNQRTLLMRNHVEPPGQALAVMKSFIDDAEAAGDLPTLLGIEGYAARLYFEHFAGMLKTGQGADFDEPADSCSQTHRSAGAVHVRIGHPDFPFDFNGRNRRPPRDPVNALLSLAYAVLAKDLTITCQAVGFDPYLGYYHQLRFGRPALALDLMEPFRPLIADSAVLSAINTRMITPRDFVRVGPSVALKPDGRKAFFRAYEQRMDTLVTHTLFGYRVNYRRVLEVQTRLLARVVSGELSDYPAFVTR